MNKAVFLDRDGVLNHEIYDYITRQEDFKILEYQIGPLKKLYDEGYLLIIITNQGGIAQQRYTEETLAEMHRSLSARFEEQGALITHAYYCPHHPTVSEECNCRKPKSGMLLEAIATYHIDPSLSVMIGDKPRDVEAANGAGVKGILIAPDEQIDYDLVKQVLAGEDFQVSSAGMQRL
ncbi:D-glycero-alpha-D-manno-heptose-1,7-bisphosphate 7-phosphatase [Pedobacter heparinus]|uniref:D,D-heptose 1,7-bisphosphate phosphatase n=1 Tax=Pedobacter heparinus (strain ATCC 13125 / DSM 2366 / CIP 104194 / JCM 7457 / NBRC 12017 / NCIMB 9290 / NRRL B-14731 / HIM 762-3) TaxID=485917 RepID=C6XXR5_PEDHD|nr:HAD family hydrolase [Pedobacter heparinus]ACU04333.1 histidinol-phosphate phosphatase family protein [Pedobacter heparinus DSM 2366]